MQGFDVRTIDDDEIGHVVDEDGEFLHRLINHSPKVNGELDGQAVLEHYGLAEGLTVDERPYSPGVTGGDRRLDLPKNRRDYPKD